MGARNSKSVNVHNKLSRWQVENGPENIPEEYVDKKVHGKSNYLRDYSYEGEVQNNTSYLNAIAALPSTSLMDLRCVTAWEDGSIMVSYPLATDSKHSERVIHKWKPHTKSVNRIVYGTQNSMIYSCSRDATISYQHLKSSDCENNYPVLDSNVSTLRGHALSVSSIAVNEQETTICSGGRDSKTILWDIQTKQFKSKNETPRNIVSCSKWIPGNCLIAQGSEDLTVKVWDERSDFRYPVQYFRGYIYFPLAMDVSSDAWYILTSSKGFSGVGCEIRVWDRRMEKQAMQIWHGHEQDATGCAFLSKQMYQDHKLISAPVSVSKDRTIKIWDVKTSRLYCEARCPYGEMFTGLSIINSSTIVTCTLQGHITVFAEKVYPDGDREGEVYLEAVESVESPY